MGLEALCFRVVRPSVRASQRKHSPTNLPLTANFLELSTSYGNGEMKLQETQQRRFLVNIQNVHPASYGVVCPGMVTVLKEGHRVLGKGSKISNKNGTWTSLVVL